MISLFLSHSSLFSHAHFADLSACNAKAESAKLECSAFHHSYFTLHSSTGCLGYGL